MVDRFRLNKTSAWSGLAALAILMLAGCGQAPPTQKIDTSDPGGLGSPQQRMEMLQKNTMMDPRLKARKMRILQDEINGSNSAPGKQTPPSQP